MLDFININKHEMLSCIYSKRLLKKLELVNAELLEAKNQIIDIAEVGKGICYAKYYHADQMRESGEPYYSHPLEVAYMSVDYLPRTDIIITAVLHDALEDTNLSKKEIEEVFGEKVAEQVYDLTRIKEDGTKLSSGHIVRVLYDQGKKDLIILKIFDRLHNLKTLRVKDSTKAKQLLEETVKDFMVLSTCSDLMFLTEALENMCDEYMLEKGLMQKALISFKSSGRLPPLT
jgi:(p)ppGpp synthase/HD superfamily hydrolase